jgi:hypothetical protein
MNTSFARLATINSRASRTSTLNLFLTMFATDSASAPGTPRRRKARAPDVGRPCAGEIPKARVITV